MKLHLPTGLRAALIAAISVVGFTLSQAAAVDAETTLTTTFGSCNQAAIASITTSNAYGTAVIGTSNPSASITSLVNSSGSGIGLKTDGDAGAMANFLSPEANVGNDDPWTMTLSYSGTDAIQSIKGITLSVGLFNAGGAWQGNNAAWTGDVTFTATINDGQGNTADFTGTLFDGIEPDAEGKHHGRGSDKFSVTLSGSTFGLSSASSYTVTLALTETLGTGTFVGLENIAYNVVATAPEVPKWNGTEAHHSWSDAESWTTAFVEGGPAVFDADAVVKTVTVDEVVTADTVTVSADYTFNTSATLTANKLTIAADSILTVNGTGSVSTGELVNKGTLSIGDGAGVTAGTAVEVAAGETFTVTGEGTLALPTLRSKGGTHDISSNLSVTSNDDRGEGNDTRRNGLSIQANNGTININDGVTSVYGATYLGVNGGAGFSGTINVGDGTGDRDSAKLVTYRLELGDTNGGTSTLNIKNDGTLIVTSENAGSGYQSAGVLLSEWGNQTTINVNGNFFAKGVEMNQGDQAMYLNIENGGVVAAKGIAPFKNNAQNTQITLNAGGKLVLGTAGISTNSDIGNWTINFNGGEVGITDDCTIARTVNVGGNVTFNTAKYTWTGADATLDLQEGSTGGTMTVSGNITGEGTVIVAGTGELQLTGEGNVLTHTIQLTSGTLTMDDGTFDISALEGGTIEEKGYEDGENKGNGFAVLEGTLQVVEITSGATLQGSLADLLYNGTTVHLNNETGAVEMGGKSLATYYVNVSGTTEKLSWALDKAGGELKGVVLDNGTTFALDAEGALDSLSLKENASATVAVSKDATIGIITAPTAGQVLGMTGEGTVTTDSLVGGGTVDIGEKIVLVNNATTAPTAKAVLSGSGTYVLAPQVLNMNSATLGDDWTGTVRISHPTHNASIDFTPFVKGTNSTLELNGVLGWSSTWNSDTPQNIKLTDNGENQAWVCSGFSQNDYTATYSGKWSGDGTYVSYSKNSGARFTNATFTGDLADWEGAFLYKSDAATSTGNVVFRDNATDVNVTIGKDGDNGTLNVKAETGATFSKNVSADQLIVNAAGKTVTLAGGADLDAATVTAGTLALSSTGLVIDALTVDSGSTLSAEEGSSLQSAVTLAGGSTLSVGADGLNLVNGASTLTLGGKIAFTTTATVTPNMDIIVATGLTEGDITGITFTGGVAVASDYLTLSSSLASYTQLQVKDGKLVLTKEAGSGGYWGKDIGSGTWDLSTANWAKADGDTPSDVFTNGEDAYFTANGGGGTITVGEAIDVATLNVSGAAYSFTGTTSLNISGGVFVSSSGSATFDQIGELPVISISGADSSMTVSSGNVTVQDLSNEGTLTVTAGNLAIGKATAKGGNVKANNLTLATGESAFGSVQVSGAVTGATKLTVGGTSAIGSVEDIGTLALANGTLALGNATGLSNTQLAGALTVSGETVSLGNVTMADGSSISSSNKVIANGITVTGTGTVKGGATLQASSVGGGTLAVENGTVGIASGSTMTVSGTLDVKSGSHIANDGTLAVADTGRVIAGNGVNLGNVAAKGTVEVNGASVSATGGSIAALDMGSGETLTVDNDLALTSTSGGNDGTLNVGGVLTAGGAVTIGNVTAGSLELTTAGSLTATGTLDTESITLRRVSKTDHYLTAGALSATTTNFVVDKAMVEALDASMGSIITLADLDTQCTGDVTINGDRSFSDTTRRVYTIMQDFTTHDIVLTVDAQESGFVWTGNEGTLWSTAGNWSGGAVPGSEDWVQVKNDANSHDIELDGDAEVSYFTVSAIDATLRGAHTLEVGSALEVNVNGMLYVGDASTPTAIETPTATINGTLVVQQRAAVQADATTINGGTLNVNDATYIAETIDMAEGTLRTSSDSFVTTGQLNGDADSIVGGHVIITGTGGRYTGGYDAAYIDIDDDAEAVLYAGEGLTLGGDGTAKLQYRGNTAIDGIDADELTILLNDPNSSSIGSTLTLRESSWLEEGSVVFGMSAIDSAATIGSSAPTILLGDLLLDTESTVVVNQDSATDAGTAMEVRNGGRTRNLVLAHFGSDVTNTRNVELNGNLYRKYFKNARIEHGSLLVDMNDTYYQTISGATSFNGRAGAGMLDDAFVEHNPQISNPNGDLAAVMNALEQGAISSEKADRVLSAMSGASHAAMGAAWNRDVDRQLRAIRNRTTSMGVAECVVNEDMPFFNVWINAEGDYTKLNNDGTLAGYKLSSWGGTVGMDVDFTNRFTMGLAITAMSGDFTACSEDNAEGDLDRLYVSVFGRYTHRAWTHTLVGTFGIADTKLKRTVDYGTGSYTTNSSSDGTAFGVMYEAGYTVALNESATTCLQPVLNLSYRHSSLDGCSETGTDAALRGGDIDMDVFTIALGARLQSVVGTSVYNRSSIFEGRVLCKLDAGDREASMHSSFVNVGNMHEVRSSEMGAFGLELGAGIVVPIAEDGGSIFFDVSAELRDKYTEVNGTVGYRYNF